MIFFSQGFVLVAKKKLTSFKNPVCGECLGSILIADKVRLTNEYVRHFSTIKIIKEIYSVYVFETDKTLQHIIHALKYERKFKVGIFLGKILSEGIRNCNWQIDMMIPIPVHHLKKAERGYNQSDYIVKGLSESLKIPYSTNLIKRSRYTESQTGMNINERKVNVANAFKVKNPNKLQGRNILLVDDIITTGATMLECGKAFLNAGVKTVYACSVGIAA